MKTWITRHRWTVLALAWFGCLVALVLVWGLVYGLVTGRD